MESFAYILILTLAIATLFFAIAFRDPRRSASDPLRTQLIPKPPPIRWGFFHGSIVPGPGPAGTDQPPKG
jgi:photosystem II PsbT protein